MDVPLALSSENLTSFAQSAVMSSAGVKHLTEEPEETFTSRYKLGEELGRGSFSVVHLATNRKTKEQVAVKVIDRAQVDADHERHLQLEMDILKRVRHPNIVRVYELIETKTKIYFIMEHAKGGELFERIIAKGHYSEADAKAIVSNILSALDYLHDMNVAHRDLKPENLLEKNRSDDFHVVLADFGLACIEGEEELIKEPCGSPGYLAPEVLTGKGWGRPVDMFSLGVITYILLCGVPPFHDDQHREKVIYRLTRKGQYEFKPDSVWDNVSPQAKDFIKHLLVVDPQQRYTAKQALAHEWLAFSIGDIACGSAGGAACAAAHHSKEKRSGHADHPHPHIAEKLAGYLHLRRSAGGHFHRVHTHAHHD